MPSSPANPRSPKQGGYPVFSDDLAAVFFALGFRLQPGAVKVIYSEEHPKSEGGEVSWVFDGINPSGTSAVGVQTAFENAGDGREAPPAYQAVNDLIEELEGMPDLPPHIKARIKNALNQAVPDACAAAIALFCRTRVNIHRAEKPALRRSKTGENAYEFEPCKT